MRTTGKSSGMAAEASAWVGWSRVMRGTTMGSRVQPGSSGEALSMNTATRPVAISVAATHTASTFPANTLGWILRQGIPRTTRLSSRLVSSRP